jgi:SAM-dependent methyltransferase
MTAAEAYAARVDAVLAQRARLRGPQPPGDAFAGLPPDHPLLASDPRRPLVGNLADLAAYVEPDDVIVDVGGGAGRYSLPLALRCREVINVDPSAAMGAGFVATAARAGIANVRLIESGWPMDGAPAGDLVLVNHVTYLTRDIVPFLRGLEASARRRVLLTVNDPPPPTMNRALFRLIHGEEEALVPGHAELADVLRALGRRPEVRALAEPGGPVATVAPNREAAIQQALAGFAVDQWTFWPMDPALATRARQVLEDQFDTLFAATEGGYTRRWLTPGREVLITWEPDRQDA